MNAVGTGGPSNEAVLVVGCSAPPSSPTALAITTNHGGVVALAWTAPAGLPGNAPRTYFLEAGTAPGAANLLTRDLGGTATTFSAGGVGSGTYYVRVRARNLCGTSSPSNEVSLMVVP